MLSRGSDQHVLELAPPYYAAAQSRKYRPALTTIGSIGFGTAHIAAIRVSRNLAKPDQIQHMDRPLPRHRAERRKRVLGWVNVSCHDFTPSTEIKSFNERIATTAPVAQKYTPSRRLFIWSRAAGSGAKFPRDKPTLRMWRREPVGRLYGLPMMT
jgi:hypothetical protein